MPMPPTTCRSPFTKNILLEIGMESCFSKQHRCVTNDLLRHLTNYYIFDYTDTIYYVPYSFHCQYPLKYVINTIAKLRQISSGSMDL